MSNVLNRTTKEWLTSVNTPEYPAEEWVVNPVGAQALVDAEVPPLEWVIEGDDSVREMTHQEKDAAFLVGAIMTSISDLDAVTKAYLHSRYPAHDLDLWTALYAEANREGLSNRAAYIDSLLDWAKTVSTAYFAPKAATLAGCTTLSEVEAVTFSVEDCATLFDASDPGVSMAVALGTPD